MFEKEFLSFCDIHELEVNKYQIIVIQKLEQFYNTNFKSFFSRIFSKKSCKKVFTYMEMWELEKQ